MKCPFCGYTDSRVVDSRPADDDSSIRRRRECLSCKQRFTTFEVIEHVQLVVIKSDGSRQAFDRSKLLNGLLKACEKRPVPLRRLEEIVDDIEQQLQNGLEREVESRRIGELAMDKLRSVDEIAYIRFASVYRRFQDISSFMDELNALLKANKESSPSEKN
ncbi:MAG: transcriptional regulator NrdR [Clostridiaceae bacterium]|nr:transcriptional regulator NrdR [Clostridiales bacterium]MDD6878316.1 transcriptional regulator NrdR [Clostridiaceae bacterium]MDY3071012.1 transcriptional regulator NrdR [Eubacteriales bacterium]MDY3286922.1 transcriptional regulator NrdR [Eubacteriales bacterium]MDY5016375.1 transcriptional regulator NrdR [Eubacteriales bacterium]